MRLLHLETAFDALQACAAAGRAVPDENLRGWAAVVEPALCEPLRHAGVPVLQGARGGIALTNLGQLWNAGRSLAATLERPATRALAEALRDAAAAVESPPRGWLGLPPERTLVMGIVNVTPDSFSDGGQHLDAAAAVAHGERLVAEGADLLDVGGESTRPHAQPLDAAEERARIEPVVRALARRVRVPISIDTTKAAVAEAALDAGARVVNDVSGLARDPGLAGVAARADGVVLMHMRGTPEDMQSRAVYADLHAEVLEELRAALARALAAGVARERIALDPGLGFAKTAAHNLLLLRRLRELAQLGQPLLVGASRKSFIGKLTGREPRDRVHGSVAAAALAASQGACIVRVHDVAATREAIAVADAVRTSTA